MKVGKWCCVDFKRACDRQFSTDCEGGNVIALLSSEEIQLGCHGTYITFCPWCGTRLKGDTA